VLPITVCIAAFCWQAADLPAQAPKPTEYQVKAAYLLNFGRFIEWPAKTGATPEEPFQVCVLGQDPFGPILDAALAGETINHAPLAAKRIAKPQDASVCRILFISASEEHSLKSILPALDKTAVLTVSDIAQFTRQGGMIQFVLSGNRVRFDVNLVAVRAAGLNLSSELLKLALSVKRTP
jgi:hypothetical protein